MNERPSFRVSDHRKAVPLGVRYAACMILLGFTPEELATAGAIVWDHNPPLKDRRWDDATGDFDPPQLDPRFLQPLRKTDSDAKTFGPGGEKRIHARNSDISEPRRLDRIAEKFRADILKPRRRGAEREKKTKPKAKLQSRPFSSSSKRK